MLQIENQLSHLPNLGSNDEAVVAGAVIVAAIPVVYFMYILGLEIGGNVIGYPHRGREQVERDWDMIRNWFSGSKRR